MFPASTPCRAWVNVTTCSSIGSVELSNIASNISILPSPCMLASVVPLHACGSLARRNRLHRQFPDFRVSNFADSRTYAVAAPPATSAAPIGRFCRSAPSRACELPRPRREAVRPQLAAQRPHADAQRRGRLARDCRRTARSVATIVARSISSSSRPGSRWRRRSTSIARRTPSGCCSHGRISAAAIAAPWFSTHARVMRFSSSRTLPGQWYAASNSRASSASSTRGRSSRSAARSRK